MDIPNWVLKSYISHCIGLVMKCMCHGRVVILWTTTREGQNVPQVVRKEGKDKIPCPVKGMLYL